MHIARISKVILSLYCAVMIGAVLTATAINTVGKTVYVAYHGAPESVNADGGDEIGLFAALSR